MNREAQGLAQTATWVKSKLKEMEEALAAIRDSNYGDRLTLATTRAINTAKRVATAFEDLETFALRISFLTGERRP